MIEFPPASNTNRHWFRARYDSDCRMCEEEINEGDWVSYSNEDPTQVICKPCSLAEDEDN